MRKKFRVISPDKTNCYICGKHKLESPSTVTKHSNLIVHVKCLASYSPKHA